MTNKPEVKRYKLESGHDSAMRKVNRMQESEGGVYVRFEDYETLQAAYEEELFQVRQDRDTHFGELVRALEQVDAMKAECERLREKVGLIICDECHAKCADPYAGLFASHCPDEEPCIMCECSSLRRQLAEQQPAPDVNVLVEALENLLRYLETDDMRDLDMNKARAALDSYRNGGE